jgi:hypothetical protein
MLCWLLEASALLPAARRLIDNLVQKHYFIGQLSARWNYKIRHYSTDRQTKTCLFVVTRVCERLPYSLQCREACQFCSLGLVSECKQQNVRCFIYGRAWESLSRCECQGLWSTSRSLTPLYLRANSIKGLSIRFLNPTSPFAKKAGVLATPICMLQPIRVKLFGNTGSVRKL